jgi:hypothetical protein
MSRSFRAVSLATIQGQTFAHLVYHLVLTYSNWEAGTICYSESLESLTEGWQNAIWELGAVPAVSWGC